ncbi:type II toxin-antitoxin system VapC family toxin [Vandammella animalimorsus]|uniref:type II toxin-antitoxin system VapC family toxin n=1 Tax=Vandammella animalimorsus TaxID=2029117 RepID=UPI001EED62C5|nr:PIN domain-containing protein [Vandammella animalimorsus]
MIFIDSNVLIDLLEPSSAWADWSEQQQLQAAARDTLVINALVYAEIARSFPSADLLDVFLHELGIGVRAIPLAAAFLASRAHQTYRQRGGARIATLPDFFIAAHAQTEGAILLTRDATRVRSYFPTLSVIAPS